MKAETCKLFLILMILKLKLDFFLFEKMVASIGV